MPYRVLADLVRAAHLAFIRFAALGGLLGAARPRLAWVHLPCAAWGAFVEFAGIVCPLTPLEDHLRRLGGEAGFTGDFIGHYLTAAIYPAGLTRAAQLVLGTVVVVLNAAVYWRLVRRRARLRDVAG